MQQRASMCALVLFLAPERFLLPCFLLVSLCVMNVRLNQEEAAGEHALGTPAALLAPKSCEKGTKTNKAGKLTEEVGDQLRAASQSNSFLCARHDHQTRFSVDRNGFS